MNNLEPSLSPGVVSKRTNDILELESLGNNTLFEKWRPQFHFLAPAGWINVNPLVFSFHAEKQANIIINTC